MTCSIVAVSEVSKEILYLARILRTGLSFNHHWVFGIRCLEQKQVGFTQWMTMCAMQWNNSKAVGDHSHKVSVLFEITERLEDRGSLPHSQNTGRVWGVSKDTAYSFKSERCLWKDRKIQSGS